MPPDRSRWRPWASAVAGGAAWDAGLWFLMAVRRSSMLVSLPRAAITLCNNRLTSVAVPTALASLQPAPDGVRRYRRCRLLRYIQILDPHRASEDRAADANDFGGAVQRYGHITVA